MVDEYAWLANQDDPDTIAYLEAENAYTEAATAHLASLRETIFEEIKRRTKETDLSVPVRKGGLLVLHPDRGGPAVRHPLPAPGRAGRDRPADPAQWAEGEPLAG